jgi:zinc/manganese transport system permease protein
MRTPQEYVELASFFAAALSTAGAVAIGGSQIGTFVLYRREGMLALALPQVVAVGVALGMRNDWPTIWPALMVAALAVIALAWVGRRGSSYWVLPSLFVAGLCVSFLIIANAGQHVTELQQHFTGIDVAVSNETAMIVTPTALVVGMITSVLWRRWLALAQAPAAAELAGLKPARWDVLFLCLLAALLMFGTYALGAVMVLAMLFLPAAMVMPWCRRIPMALLSGAIAAVMFLIAGFVMSIEQNWPLSHSVGGVGFAGVAVSHAVRAWMRR